MDFYNDALSPGRAVAKSVKASLEIGVAVIPPMQSLGRLSQIAHSRIRKASAIACAALAIFANGRYADWFEDEFAYISQSYYADLFFAGQFNDGSG